MSFTLTRDKLMTDLYVAFEDAARHKHKMSYVQKFEKHLHRNLDELCDDLMSRKYKAQPSKCFVIDYPKKREVFAAIFRDRVVHHLYFNYAHDIFERTFIADTYSCIKGRGTHYGIDRLRQHIRQESRNWQLPCYAMNLDIRGYFMHINRKRLLDISTDTLLKMASHRVNQHYHERWCDLRDIDFLLWFTEQIVMLDPKVSCDVVGDYTNWVGLDRNKSLFFTPEDCGLPIGNLTSQLFSNVYLNVFDQFMKRELKCEHYGRYVDDAFLVSRDKHWMLSLIPDIRNFLSEQLGLDLHMGKLHIRDILHGVEFIGAFVKPYRTYASNKTIQRMNGKIQELDVRNTDKALHPVNSFLGVLGHSATYNIRREIFLDGRFDNILEFDRDILSAKPMKAFAFHEVNP